MAEQDSFDKIDWNINEKKSTSKEKWGYLVVIVPFVVFSIAAIAYEAYSGSSGLFFPTMVFFGTLMVLVVAGLKYSEYQRNRGVNTLRELRSFLGGKLSDETASEYSGVSESSLEGEFSGIAFRVENVYLKRGKHSERFIRCFVQCRAQPTEFSFKRIDGFVDKIESKASGAFGVETIGNVMVAAKDKNAARAFLTNFKPGIEQLLAIAEPIECRDGKITAKIRIEFSHNAVKLKEAVGILSELAKK